MRRSLLLLAAFVMTFAGAGVAAAQTTAFGDTLFSFNAGLLTPTPDRALGGIAFAEGHFWITGFNPPVYDHRLYKISADGSELVSSTSLATGYHAFYDLAYDGEFLYATDRDHLAQIDPATGQLTGVQIPTDFYPYLVAGVAYDPATDHFWVIPARNGQLQVIHEIDRDGTVLNTYPNLDTDYTTSLTWDTWSPGGPFLWTFGREEIGYDSRSVLRQFSPTLGAFTGVELEPINRSEFALDGPRGSVLTDALDPNRVTMATVQAGSLEPTDGLDWVVVYDADLQNTPPPQAQIAVSPGVIDTDVEEDSTIQIPVVISNTGTLDLTWDAYAENTSASGGDGELGDVLTVTDLSAIIDSFDVAPNGLTFARGHYWLTARVSGSGNQSRLLKIAPDGSVAESYAIGTASGAGWRTIATDGDFIYGSDQYVIAVWSIDEAAVVDNVFTGDIGPSGLAYDPNNEHFYLSARNGAIEVLDRDGEEVRLVVTPYALEGLAWDDLSPGGPFLWAWAEPNGESEACCEAIQLDPVTGLATGVTFTGESQGDLANVPRAAVVTRDLVPGRLAFIGLQETEGYNPDAAYFVGYDLDVTPPPAWLGFEGGTVGSVAPGSTDTLTVAIHGTMADTTTAAVIRIGSNDLGQPLVEIPVTTTMFASTPVSVADDPAAAPELFVLQQNYPNPFGASTQIRFDLRETSTVSLEIFDVRGRRVVAMERAPYGPGQHTFAWDGTDANGRTVASGVYLYTLTVGDRSETRKMLLMR